MNQLPERVGLLGLGAIGTHYRSRLLRAYSDLVVFDQDEEARNIAGEAGAQIATDLADLASKCDVIVVSLPNPPAVLDALGSSDGLLSHASAGTVILDTSTVSPEVSRRMFALASERGAHYLDAPVSGGEPLQGGVDGARSASMTFMVGGGSVGFELAKPVMSVLGKFWFHLGEAGSGTIVKLISNLCSGVYMHVVAEAFALGEAHGFSIEQLVEVFEHTDAKCFMMTDYILPRLERSELSPGFSVELQLKDHRLAGELGHAARVPLPMNGAAMQLWEAMRAQGRGNNDITDSVIFARAMAGRSDDSLSIVA